MKRLLLMIAMVFAYHSYGICEDKLFSIQSFGGIVDKIASDKIKDNMATDAVNVDLDRVVGNITKRRGYQKYNSTALTGSQAVRKLYTYKQVDGDEYILANSSTSVFYSKGDGSFTAIISTLSASYTCDFATALDKAYFSNGSDNPYRWNGTTLEDITDTAISTGMVKARFLKYHNNRMFYAGVDSYRSTVYYSEVNDPTNIDTFNYININVSDGENITGMFVWNGTLYIFKSHSTWTINEISAGNFIVRNVSREIGCLYQDSIAEQGGIMTFLSHRGIEKYDGAFNLISEPIDTQIKDLRQLVVGQNEWEQTTAADWGAGSGTNIDTTTYSGSVAKFNGRIGLVSSGLIAVSSNGTNVLASGNECVYTSNMGTTFIINSAGVGSQYLGASSDFSAIVSGADRYPYLSTNFGASWTSFEDFASGLPTPVIDGSGQWESPFYTSVSMSSDGDKMTLLVDNGYIYISGDSGLNWTQKAIVGDWTSCSMSDDGTVRLAVDNLGKVYVSTDDGVNWSAKSITVKAWRGAKVSSDGVIQAVVSADGYVYVSTNTGTSWVLKTATPITQPDFPYIDISGDGITMITGKSLYVSTNTGGSWTSTPTSDSGYIYNGKISTDGNTIATISYTGYINILNTSASFSSQIKDIGSKWQSWSTFFADNIIPSGCGINYYIKTAATSAGIASATPEAISDSHGITSVVGPFIQIIASFTVTDYLYVPKINSLTVKYYETSIPTIGTTYKDAYWLAVATDSTKSYNNMVYRYDKNGNWTKYSNMNIGGATISRNKLYTGSADNQGYVYEQDVKDRFKDASDESYDSYWQSKMFDMGSPLNDKLYKILYTTWKYQDTTDTPYVKYRMFIDTGTWTPNDVTYTTTGHHLQKTHMTHSKRSRYLQLQVGDDSDTDFEIMGIFGLYEVLPIR
jgi:hypothetical protein